MGLKIKSDLASGTGSGLGLGLGHGHAYAAVGSTFLGSILAVTVGVLIITGLVTAFATSKEKKQNKE